VPQHDRRNSAAAISNSDQTKLDFIQATSNGYPRLLIDSNPQPQPKIVNIVRQASSCA
jgi:hypothetical protein